MIHPWSSFFGENNFRMTPAFTFRRIKFRCRKKGVERNFCASKIRGKKKKSQNGDIFLVSSWCRRQSDQIWLKLTYQSDQIWLKLVFQRYAMCTGHSVWMEMQCKYVRKKWYKRFLMAKKMKLQNWMHFSFSKI